MVSIAEFKPNEVVFKDIEREFAKELVKRENAGKIVAGALVGSAFVASSPAFATGGADPAAAAATVAAGVTAAKTMLAGIDSVTISVFAIALTPIGFMLTLSVLNRVLSRV